MNVPSALEAISPESESHNCDVMEGCLRSPQQVFKVAGL